jgi:arabinogalactan endo-1,4-beta-galactosidase/dienelactone hydrolase
MKSKILFAAMLAFTLSSAVTAADAQAGHSTQAQEILLWPNGAPGSEGKTAPEKVRISEEGDHVISGINKPSITPFLPAPGTATGVAVIIAPGGGHSELWIDHEGYNPAKYFQSKGIAAFVLKYRLAREAGSTYTIDGDELADIQRAIRTVRSRAGEWGIDKARIGVMGFSAGGELAALAAMRFDSVKENPADVVDAQSSRPDFQALMYPGNSRRFEVAKNAPPVFIVGGYQDRPDISEGVAQVYLKYKQAGVPAELHIYEGVGHGFGIRSTNKGAIAGWPDRFIEWLSEIGMLKGTTAKRAIGKMLGADISFLPELESRGMKFTDNGVQKDALQILKDHQFNYIRLRIFNNPAADSGYSPGKGFCDLAHTLAMAGRVKAAGMKLLLDFHYSDTWADPGKQFKPAAWKGYTFEQLTRAIREYTKSVLTALKKQGTLPDMVQIGNEINHGILWPDGSTKNMDTLAAFLKAGIAGVNDVDPSINIMLHIACGGQNDQSRYFVDNMLARHVDFDVIGESYYPQWHGTLDQLKNNLTDLATRYKQDVVVAEYTQHKKEVNDIEFNLPDGKGKGTFIWEPLNTWEFFVDKDGKTNDLIDIYPGVAKKYHIK